MGTRGIRIYSRSLKYTDEEVKLPNGTSASVRYSREKGIDIRIALDMVRMARENRYDVALIFSQDQDLSEVADEVKSISIQQNRWIKVACAFPSSPSYKNQRGIEKTEWIRMDQVTYDRGIDPNDYRKTL